MPCSESAAPSAPSLVWEIDRLHWAARLSLTAYGVRVGIQVTDCAVVSRVQAVAPPGWRHTEAVAADRLYSLVVPGARSVVGMLYRGVTELERSSDLDDLLDTLHRDMQLYVAERARNRVFVHAGVVGWQGSAILLPAASFGGKSTLVAALVRAGAAYYSDEYAVLDGRGWVHPYARPLRLRSRGARRWLTFTAEELGGSAGTEPLPVGRVVLTKYQEGARWSPTSLSPGHGVLQLLLNTVPARRKPKAVMQALTEVARHATILQGPRGDADQMAALLLAGRPQATGAGLHS